MITTHSLKVIGLILPVIAAVATLVRLFERHRTARFGHDDGFAALSLIILIAFDTALILHVGDPTGLSQFSRFALYYVIAEGFYGIIWTARLSILFTIIRISPAGSLYKRLLYIVSVSYLLIWIVLSGQIFWVCESRLGWKEAEVPQCPLEDQVPIAQLISDVYADAILIAAPLKLLWSYDGSLSQRTRLIVSFSASVVTTITSLVHAYYLVARPGTPVVLFAAVIELSSSLFVCNLTVLCGVFSRLLNMFVLEEGEKSVAQSTCPTSPVQTLTGWAATTFRAGTTTRSGHFENTTIKSNAQTEGISSIVQSKV